MPFSTMHYREDPEYWAKWFPADFITESFPGQFRNWFYAMLAMSTVLRREEPFRTIFGYATLFGEDGRPMHKSWGNAIEFDEAAERMGVDVMRWMYASRTARRQHPVRLARRRRGAARPAGAVERLRVLRHLRPARRLDARRRCAPPVAERPPLDRWILSRAAGVAAEQVEARLRDFDAEAATAGPRRVHRRPLHVVPAPVAAPDVARHGRGPGRGVRDAPRGAGRPRADRRPDPAVPGRVDVRQPRGRRSTPPRPTAST